MWESAHWSLKLFTSTNTKIYTYPAWKTKPFGFEFSYFNQHPCSICIYFCVFFLTLLYGKSFHSRSTIYAFTVLLIQYQVSLILDFKKPPKNKKFPFDSLQNSACFDCFSGDWLDGSKCHSCGSFTEVVCVLT